MLELNPLRSIFRRVPASGDPRPPIVIFVTSLAGVFIVLLLALPAKAVLPVFSLCALGAAACAAIASAVLQSKPVSAEIGWNLAGAFTLVGCAAAILGEPEFITEYVRPIVPRSRLDD
ncbi:MAG TPA: hypothetical protein VFP60_16625 [Pseudolabrys sp.]|nr:hypothetical protein [Pseudolabrys sp.]